MVARKRPVMTPSRFVVEGETVAPRTKDERYRVYRVKNGGPRSGRNLPDTR